MSEFVIIPDSSCDLSRPLRERFGIPDYFPGNVVFPDGSNHKADLDWGCITPEQYYGSMKDRKHIYTTSVSSIEECAALYSKYLEQGKDILSVSLSTGLSGTYNVCMQTAKLLSAQYPDRKIICVDSLRYSTSLSLLIVLAAQRQMQGQSIEQVAQWMEENKHCIHQMGSMDDLFFLCRTGRVSNFKALFGTIVGINPMADFNRAGMSEVLTKCKGKAQAFAATVEYIKRTAIEPKEQLMFIAHSDRKEYALKLKELIETEIKPKEVILNDVGMACGASIGPGLVAAFYYGKEISQDLSGEKAVMKEIIEGMKK